MLNVKIHNNNLADVDYNEQPMYKIDYLYSEGTESDNNITKNLYRSYLLIGKVYQSGLTQGRNM